MYSCSCIDKYDSEYINFTVSNCLRNEYSAAETLGMLQKAFGNKDMSLKNDHINSRKNLRKAKKA